MHPAPWYGEHDVDLRLGTAVRAVHAAGREVHLADGERIGYDALLLATGSSAPGQRTIRPRAGAHMMTATPQGGPPRR